VWLTRGRVIKDRYPDAATRRRIYRTSLSPRSALRLVARADAIRAALVAGANYATLSVDDRLAFIAGVLTLILQVPSFHLNEGIGSGRNRRDWQIVLRWWLAKASLARQPATKDITKWYEFAAGNFIHRSVWGLGSILGLMLDLVGDDGPIRALEIDDWPRSGLPWIAFWLKELLLWGTLEPVAAFLLARGDAIDRPSAEDAARAYYEQLPDDTVANEVLDPRRIREWMTQRAGGGAQPAGSPATLTVDATLAREAAVFVSPRLNVIKFEADGTLHWIDPAGYVVVRSPRPREWPAVLDSYDFHLDVAAAVVRGEGWIRTPTIWLSPAPQAG
jgi:hypothetical protein